MRNIVETFLSKCAENSVCPGCINYLSCEEVPGGRHRMWAGVENPKGNNHEFIVSMHEVWEVIEWQQGAIAFQFPHINMTTL